MSIVTHPLSSTKEDPMTQSRNLADFLQAAGVKTAAASTTTTPAAPAPAAPAAPAKTAAKAPAKPVEQPKAAEQKPVEQPKAAAAAPAIEKTAAQKWLAEHGVVVEDAKVAETLYQQQSKIAEMNRYAELEKLAEEERARGAIFYQGMVKESTAMQLALGQADIKTAELTARLVGVPTAAIVKRAEELAAAVGQPALVGTDLGRAARTTDSAMLQAGERNENTTDFQPEAASGTRAPVSGQDEKTMRFVDVWTLPGNPGLNHGQAVDQGKGNG
jgi:hypothetical protein